MARAASWETPLAPLARYDWDFDYRGTAASFSTQATGAQTTIAGGFPLYGVHTIALRVTDDNPQGPLQAISVCNVTVKPTPHCPIADVGGGPSHTYHVAPAYPQLDAIASFDGDGDPMTFSWSFSGNGLFADATGRNRTRTFSTPGTFAVGVQVTDHPSSTPSPTPLRIAPTLRTGRSSSAGRSAFTCGEGLRATATATPTSARAGAETSPTGG